MRCQKVNNELRIHLTYVVSRYQFLHVSFFKVRFQAQETEVVNKAHNPTGCLNITLILGCLLHNID